MSLRLGKQMLKNINHRQLFPPTRESISGRRTRYMKMLQPFRGQEAWFGEAEGWFG